MNNIKVNDLTNSFRAEKSVLSNKQLYSESVNKSWFEEVEAFELKKMEETSKSLSSLLKINNNLLNENDKSAPQSTSSQWKKKPATESNGLKEEYFLSSDTSEEKETSCDREIIVKFLDSSNEEKYERLVKEEKIKTPLKRRLSSNSTSRSTSPFLEEGTNQSAQTTNNDANTKPFFSKKTRIDSEGAFVGHEKKKNRNREYETNEAILARRQKQIDYGKNTIGYDKYSNEVPREKRTSEDPWTPPKNHKYSRRAFDGLIKVWRKKLHCYDPASMEHEQDDADSSDEDV